ncbi:haloacid dehalogenase [Halobacillus andaensis]|uniref:Haloacid dehalogenase n=1 Tax=Halobacillus andaensis TaxID=1176239 RepID=A0A917B5Z4_HALAA|nr:HAD family hydrolase [Halobacillus andaensis]MBP2006157.1 Cof subfamily protein (haloacid dehalogenase superfamily) [Halobacillus andaensis]GGF23239.1 haloacid dehalogenase [Halobacillus andaensis]
MIKLFISDLDGTLLGMNHYIKPQDIEALKKLTETGVDLAVASGRMDHDIAQVLTKVGVTGHRISQNGAFVYDSNSEPIYSKSFDIDKAKEVMNFIKNEPMVKTVSTKDKIYTSEHNKWVDLISEQLFQDVIIEPNLISHFGEHISPAKITLHGKEDDVILASSRVRDQFGTELDSFISHESCVDIMPQMINKGNGIKALLDTIGINPNEIACIGDSFNDLPMFEVTPHSYAMSNAHPDVQKKAEYVVDHVYEAIEDLKTKELY